MDWTCGEEEPREREVPGAKIRLTPRVAVDVGSMRCCESADKKPAPMHDCRSVLPELGIKLGQIDRARANLSDD